MSQPTNINLLIRSVVDVHFGTNVKVTVANIGGEKLKGNVVIISGEKDENLPFTLAYS